MLLFRSEEHVRRWTERRGTVGATLTTLQGWQLATAWFEDCLSPDWRRTTPEEARAIFDRVGLVGAFWQLTEEVSGLRSSDTPEA
jgi:hypothetical protein